VHLVVLTPVLDDWVSARELLSRLDAVLASRSDTVSVLLVDDGSSFAPDPDFGSGLRLQKIEVLKLKKNLGHQRALAVGLCHIADKMSCDAIVIMDGDGEDDPTDVVRLMEKLAALTAGPTAMPPIIFAERTRRSESFTFQVGYAGYRALHYVLTGRGIRFGNFSIIPRARLAGLTIEPMLWNHYAASVAASRLPLLTLPSTRGKRIAGRSHQSFVKLVIHGLSALSCYNETIGVRLLLISSFLLVLSFFAIVGTIVLRLVTQIPLPGWTSLFAGLLVIFLLQVLTLASNFTMQIISARSVQPFLPAREYIWYIDELETYPRPA
jgi:glycosyltransferase involved in cell wall biosynthesis